MASTITATVEVSDLIDCLRKRWSSSENEEVIKTVASCIGVVNPVKPPTNIHAIAVKKPEFIGGELVEAIAKVWCQIDSWESIVDGVTIGEFFVKNDERWRVIHLEESKTFPQHFYNDSVEIVHILHAQNGAEIGQCDQWTTDLQSDSIHFFGYSAPKMIKSGKGPLLAFSMLKGSDNTINWPDEKCGRLYADVQSIAKGKVSGVKSVEKYYDKLAEDYEAAVRAWGYCLPEACIDSLVKYAQFDANDTNVTVLDLGCGSGMCGEALCKRGSNRKITGLDISQKKPGCGSQT